MKVRVCKPTKTHPTVHGQSNVGKSWSSKLQLVKQR